MNAKEAKAERGTASERFWNSRAGKVVFIMLCVAVLLQAVGALGYVLFGWR